MKSKSVVFVFVLLSILVVNTPKSALSQGGLNAALTDVEKFDRAKAYAIAVVNACDLKAEHRGAIIQQLQESFTRLGADFQPNDFGDFHWFEFPKSAGIKFSKDQLSVSLKDLPGLSDSIDGLVEEKDQSLRLAMATWFTACVDARLALPQRERRRLADLLNDRCFDNSSRRLLSLPAKHIGIERILVNDRVSNEDIGEVLGTQRRQLWERMIEDQSNPNVLVLEHNDTADEWKRLISESCETVNQRATEEMKLRVTLLSTVLEHTKEELETFENQMAAAMEKISQAYTQSNLDGLAHVKHTPDSKSTIYHPTFASWHSKHPIFREALKANLSADKFALLMKWNLDRKRFIEKSAIEMIVCAIDAELMLSDSQRVDFEKMVKKHIANGRHMNLDDNFREFRLVAETLRNFPSQEVTGLTASQINSWKSFQRQMKSRGQTIGVCLGQPTVCQIWQIPIAVEPTALLPNSGKSAK